MAHTPQQGSRVRPSLPEASPFSSVLARLPDLSPPRTKYTTSFGSLHGPLASPPPTSTTFGFRPQGGQTPGDPRDANKAMTTAFDLLASTPIKSLPPPEQQLCSPRFDLQSPKFPLFQPSPRKPLDALKSPPTVRLGDSTAAPLRSFSSPFGSLLDGSSRSAPSPANAAGGAGGPSAGPSNSAEQQRQHRFAALFTPAALDGAASLGADVPLPAASLDPAYLSLRPPAAGGIAQRTSSSGSGAADVADEQQPSQPQSAEQDAGQDAAVVLAQAAADAAAAAVAATRGEASAAAGSSADAGTVAHSRRGRQLEDDEDYEVEEDEEDSGEDNGEDEDDEDYTTSASFRRPPPRRRSAAVAGVPAVGVQQQQHQELFRQNQRPMRRRMLQFGAGGVAAAEEEVEATPLVHSQLPQSPMCQPVRMDVDLVLPIPKLRDPSSASEDGSGSPSHRLRTAGYSLDSPAVQAAAHAAVAAALEASAGTGPAPTSSRRPTRAAAAGAAAAAKAAAEAAGTPVQRRTSSHPARTTSSAGGSLSSVLPPITPGEEGVAAAQVLFSGPKKCNCKKSKCLKLYCDCFANGGYCGPSCSCINCANKVENSDMVRTQREAIKQRNPNAFVQKIEADATLGGQHRRGCNCRKSHCMKKYCECFQAGVPCGEHCKCESCHNTAGHAARRPPGGGASKRARSSAVTVLQQRTTRQHATRQAVGTATLSQHLEQAAAASLQAAMAQAGASIAAGAMRSAPAGERSGDEQQLQQQPVLLPLLQPGVLKGSDGSAPLMIPIALQLPGGGSAPPPLPLPLGPPAPTAAPALAAFAAAASQPMAGAGAAGATPSHVTSVAALVGLADTGAAVAEDKGTVPAGAAFSFHPASVDGSSSGHSTPRAAGVRAAAAAADVAFSLDTPAAAAGAGALTGAPVAGGLASLLDKLLPVGPAAAGDGDTTAPAAPAATAGSKGTPTAPASARATPTKSSRKPARTMTAALM